MPVFNYKAMNKKGQVVSGVSTASSLADLTTILRGQELFLVEGRTQSSGSAEVAPKPVAVTGRIARSEDYVDPKQVVIFTSELLIMVRTAVPIAQALDGLAGQQLDPTFKAILQDICRSVQEGKSLSVAFARYPRTFDSIYLSLLSAGEASGKLTAVLERIVAYIRFQIEIAQKVRSALLYPVIVVVTSFSVVSFLVLFILPTFVEVFTQLGVELPTVTKLLVGTSENIRAHWPLYLIGLLAAWKYTRWWVENPANARVVDTLRLSLPLLGPLTQAIVLTRVLRTLGTLLASGVPVLYALDLTRAASGNSVYSSLLDKVYRSASEGHGLAAALYENRYFPRSVANMISNAEKAGTMPEVLFEVASFYEKDVESRIRDVFTVAEPIFVAFLGMLVCGIAGSILLPIFQLSHSLE